MAAAENVDVHTQRKEIESLLRKPLKKGDTWYVVHTEWFKQWMKYVGHESRDASPVGNESANPGPISNSPLVKEGTDGVLKEHLMDELDFILVPEEAWSKLVSWYSVPEGGAVFPRKVIEQGMFVKQCSIEVYLMDLKLCENSDMDNTITRSFSRADTIDVLEKAMRDLFHIDETKEVRLWDKFMKSTYELLCGKGKDSGHKNTVQDAGLYQGQVIVIEQQNVDGTWPRPAPETSFKIRAEYSSGRKDDIKNPILTLLPSDGSNKEFGCSSLEDSLSNSRSEEATNWRKDLDLKQRQKYMFEGKYTCDITLKIGKELKEVMAHKFILISGSPVLESLVTTMQSSTLQIEDVEPHIFNEVLRYLYYEEVELTQKSALPILQAARKFEIQVLYNHCRKYILSNININNVFHFLTESVQYNLTEIIDKCMHFVLLNARIVIKSEQFAHISKVALIKIVSSDQIADVSETDIFKSCISWAENFCRKTGQAVTDKNKRDALGDCLRHIRFPLMSSKDFMMVTKRSELLTADERANVYEQIIQRENALAYDGKKLFETKQRSPKYLKINRFQHVGIGVWNNLGSKSEIMFLCEQNLSMKGVGLYCGEDGRRDTVKVQLLNDKNRIIADSGETFIFPDGSASTFAVILQTPVRIAANNWYKIYVDHKGKQIRYGQGGCDRMEGHGVKFRFKTSPNYDATSTEKGQIPEIIFDLAE